MAHRIRKAMEHGPLADKLSGVVEADETYIGGRRRGGKRGRGSENKTPVVSLVQRKGSVRSAVMERLTGENLKNYIKDNVEAVSTVMTDELSSYTGLGQSFVEHKVIKHSAQEYVRGEVHTNTAEGFFSILKRGIGGIYHHVSKHHLPRYLAEFDFRYNTRELADSEKTIAAILGVAGNG